ncbi:MAG TPA: anthranilate synthase component I family protein [Segetibacter sp.]|nr:anthranilate synthase component I family protein [Segetibacter sp.]
MTRVYHSFRVEDIKVIKQQMLSWASRFNICCFLDSQQYKSDYSSFECLLGVGALANFEPEADFFNSLSSFIDLNNDWIFGHFNYELKNKIDFPGTSKKTAEPAFPTCFLFVPEIVFILKENELVIGVILHDAFLIYSEITKEVVFELRQQQVAFTPIISRDDYLERVSQLKEHIHHGDCYEINFCQQFVATIEINPVAVYSQLIKISSNPFSAFYRIHDNYLLSASPERYLKKIGDKLISQPIKGTIARSNNNLAQDALAKNQLIESAKDRSENVMIVDLVRNDLSKICEEGSVRVEELFGIYSFPLVHHMISTVVGNLKKSTSFSDILKATFPMGSMTGAPKKKVMELIDQYEQSRRGIYSGAVGYFTPEKDFDFNVVIRSIVYNKTASQVSFHTGGAITASSDPEKEYEECLLKASAIMKIFSEDKKG